LQHVIILKNIFIFVAYRLSQDLLTATGTIIQLVIALSVLRPFQPWPVDRLSAV